MQRLSVARAAEVLGVSEQAIYARVKRDTIRHEKGEDGNITVYLPDEGGNNHSTTQPVDQPLVNDYITALKSEIETLKAQTEDLISDREEWKEEARRKDTIIAQVNQSLAALINRVPELEAPLDATESSVSRGKEESRGDVPPEPEKRSWWRRVFGT